MGRRSISYASHDPASPKVSPAAVVALAIGLISGPTGLLFAGVVGHYHPPDVIHVPMRVLAFLSMHVLAGAACWMAAARLRHTPHLWGVDLIKVGVGATCAWPVSVGIFLLLSHFP